MTNGPGRSMAAPLRPVLPDEALAVKFRIALTTAVALAMMLAATPLPSRTGRSRPRRANGPETPRV